MAPPEDAWGDDERLDEWFAMLKAEREAKKAGTEGLEEVPQTQNEYARELLRGR